EGCRMAHATGEPVAQLREPMGGYPFRQDVVRQYHTPAWGVRSKQIGGTLPEMKIKAKLLPIATVALAILALLGYWFLAPREKEVATILVEAAPAQRLLAVNGRIRPRLQVDIRPAVGGELVSLPFDVGDRITAGQVLAR